MLLWNTSTEEPLRSQLQETHSHKFCRLQQPLLTSTPWSIGMLPRWRAEADDLVAPCFCRRSDVPSYLIFCCCLLTRFGQHFERQWGCWEGGGQSRGALQCISVRLSVVPLNLCQAMVVLLITSQKNKVLGILVKRFCHQDTL